jgi:uncharacterized membrane protein YecN with MAPEG domain
MQTHALTALVTILALLLYLWTGIRVAFARRRCGIHAPQMTGDAILERHIRVQANTLEWLPLFLVPLWLLAVYGNDRLAAALGVIWILGRIVYALGYVAEPRRREIGFMIQALACIAMIALVLWRLSKVVATVGV